MRGVPRVYADGAQGVQSRFFVISFKCAVGALGCHAAEPELYWAKRRARVADDDEAVLRCVERMIRSGEVKADAIEHLLELAKNAAAMTGVSARVVDAPLPLDPLAAARARSGAFDKPIQ